MFLWFLARFIFLVATFLLCYPSFKKKVLEWYYCDRSFIELNYILQVSVRWLLYTKTYRKYVIQIHYISRNPRSLLHLLYKFLNMLSKYAYVSFLCQVVFKQMQSRSNLLSVTLLLYYGVVKNLATIWFVNIQSTEIIRLSYNWISNSLNLWH